MLGWIEGMKPGDVSSYLHVRHERHHRAAL